MRTLIKSLGLIFIVGLVIAGCDSSNIQGPDTDEATDIMEMQNHAFLSGTLSLNPFTQNELDNNWVADRQFPSGGVESVTFAGRDNVAAIGVVGADQSTAGAFYYFEGIKKVDNFGTDVQVDLYVPSEWQDANIVNVGFWTSDDPLSAYPLIVYRNSSEVDAGFYTYDVVFDEDANQWVGVYNLSDAPVNYNSWNTLAVTLNTDEDEANYTVNGLESGSMYASGDNIGQVFLNHYNDGVRDYTAYWHAGLLNPTSKNDCKKGGYAEYGFSNQGQCVRFVNTGKDSR